MRWTSTAKLVESTVRAAAAVPSLAMRRAVMRTRMEELPAAEAAALVQGLLERGRSAQGALIGLAAWQIEIRLHGQRARLEALRQHALATGAAAAAAVLDDAPAHKSLAPLGRLREIGMQERASLQELRSPAGRCPHLQLHFLEQARLHHSPVMVRRLLAQRYLRPRDALVIAARRPTTAAIAYEVARSDRWLAWTIVREALVMNPFSPTGLSLALAPTLGAPILQHLRDAGDVHPALALAAASSMALERQPALVPSERAREWAERSVISGDPS